MKGALVDSNVILDVLLDDPVWADWSEFALSHYGEASALYINPVIYAEVSVGFEKIEEMEAAMAKSGFQMIEIPKESLFLAGKTYLQYRKSKGIRRSPLPDFFIGAQAAVLGLPLITRDVDRYRTYFPTLTLVCPES